MVFLFRFVMIIAALASLGLTVLDILRDHMGVDTNALLYSSGNAMLAYVGDALEGWSQLLASLAGGGDPVVPMERMDTSSTGRSVGRGDPQASLVVQLVAAILLAGIAWALIAFGRRRA